FFSSRRRHTRSKRDWSSDVCSSDLMDLGVSSPQLDEAQRGFSFTHDGPLDMRMNNRTGQTAAQWLATASINDMKEVLHYYGEERHAIQIAKAIATRRKSSPLQTTHEDRKSTRLNSSHVSISYAVFCLKNKKESTK